MKNKMGTQNNLLNKKIKIKNNEIGVSKIDPFFFCFPQNKRNKIN
jgi:dihydroorotase